MMPWPFFTASARLLVRTSLQKTTACTNIKAASIR